METGGFTNKSGYWAHMFLEAVHLEFITATTEHTRIQHGKVRQPSFGE